MISPNDKNASPQSSSLTMQSFGRDYRAVVIGASGGIGRAFVALLEDDPGCAEVLALGRSSDPPVDVCNEVSIQDAADRIEPGGPVALVIDATGLLHDDEMMPEKALDAVTPEAMARAFAVNASGPLLLLKHFRRVMPREGKAVFATLSARVGSISDNRLGGWYSYRASKAALNMFVKSASIEIARRRPEAVVLALHPGTVETGLSAPFRGSRTVFTPEDAAAGLLGVIEAADPTQSGGLYAYDGSAIDW